MGKDFGKYLKKLGIEYRVSTAYHPQTNGQAESSNKQLQQQQQQQQHSLFSQASWGRLEMKPERNKFKVQAH